MSPTRRSTSGNSQRPDAINAYKYGCRVKNPFLRFSSQVRRSFEGDRAATRQDQFSGQLHPLEKRRGRPKSPRARFLARESVDHAEGARQSMCSRRPSRPLGASVVARHEQAREAAVEALPRRLWQLLSRRRGAARSAQASAGQRVVARKRWLNVFLRGTCRALMPKTMCRPQQAHKSAGPISFLRRGGEQ